VPNGERKQRGAAARRGPLNLVLLGLPGAGKGTQGVQFARRHAVPAISTGNMLREAVARGTELGQEVAEILNQGRLVPDDLIVRVVRERLHDPDTAEGFVLDGFPRTLQQATALDTMVAGRGPLVVVYLEISTDVILERVLSRRTCESCGQSDTGAPTNDYCASCGGSFVKRADDHIDIVRQRLRAYAESTEPLVEWYRARPMFRAVEGNLPLADVARALDAAVLECMEKVSKPPRSG
jgi:adenylate kinase